MIRHLRVSSLHSGFFHGWFGSTMAGQLGPGRSGRTFAAVAKLSRRLAPSERDPATVGLASWFLVLVALRSSYPTEEIGWLLYDQE